MDTAERIARGLLYLKTLGKVSTDAEHDAFYARVGGEADATPEARAEMERLGWHRDEWDDGWEIFT